MTNVRGTVGIKVGDTTEKATRTTPESPDLQETFAKMRDAGCNVVSMEVSSHALELKRTAGFEATVTDEEDITKKMDQQAQAESGTAAATDTPEE